MTPGQRALAEAARAESARIYGVTERQHRAENRIPGLTIDEHDLVIDARRAAAGLRVVREAS